MCSRFGSTVNSFSITWELFVVFWLFGYVGYLVICGFRHAADPSRGEIQWDGVAANFKQHVQALVCFLKDPVLFAVWRYDECSISNSEMQWVRHRVIHYRYSQTACPSVSMQLNLSFF